MSCCHLPNGTLLGSYEIKGVLGQGGFGISYWAIDRQLGREIVLKEHYPVGLCKRDIDGAEVIPADSSQENDYNRSLASFCREARIVAALDHPGIVRIHDIFQALGTAYIVMAFAEGCTLDQWLAQHSQDPNQVQKLLLSLLDILSYPAFAGSIPPGYQTIQYHGQGGWFCRSSGFWCSFGRIANEDNDRDGLGCLFSSRTIFGRW